MGSARLCDDNRDYSGVGFPRGEALGQPWFGRMSVAPNGRIDVIWNDTRNDPVDPWLPTWSELYYTCSLDAGETWLPEIPVSPAYEHGIGYPVQRKMAAIYAACPATVGLVRAYAATFHVRHDGP